MDKRRKLQAIEDLRELTVESGKLETVKMDMLIILDEIKSRVEDSLEEETWITEDVEKGAEENEAFQREHGAYDLFHKEDRYDENFRVTHANTWMEYGLGAESSVNQ